MGKSDEKTVNPNIKHALGLDGDPQHIKDHYASWAEKYDQDVGDGGYRAPRVMVECLQQVKPGGNLRIDPMAPGNRIHDVGCGTGLVGVELKKLGFTCIDGSDLSGEMVEQARPLGVYRHLSGDVDITQPLPESWRKAYDIVMCCGVFTCGHVPPDTLYTLLDMVIPGGLVIVSTRIHYYDDSDYQQTSDRCLSEGRAELLFNLRDAPYTSDGNSHYWVYLPLE